MNLHRIGVAAAIVLALLVTPLPADVHDDAGRFGPEAVKKANALAAEMREKVGKDFVVETFAEIPADKKAAYEPAKKAAFFKTWAGERAKARKVNGIYILICKDPTYLQVTAGVETRKKAFPNADVDRLAQLILQHFQKREFDAGLTEGAAFALKTLEANLKDEPRCELAGTPPGVKVTQYAPAPGYSEGPTWRDGDLFFCSGALLRVDKDKKVFKYLDIGPAGTYLCGDGHILVCDNKVPALLDVSPEGKVGVVVDKFDGKKLNSLNDLTVDKDGNIYWTDPSGSTRENPIGAIFRVRPDGRVDRIADNLAFPNGLDVDPENKYLYVIESQTAKIPSLRLPADDKPLGPATVFYALGGSGGDGCVFDAAGNLWVADFSRPKTDTVPQHGRITVLSPAGKALAYLDVPAKVVSNITFGGPDHDEIFLTTGDPPGVFHAKVGVKGFKGHPGKPRKILRDLDLKPLNEPLPSK